MYVCDGMCVFGDVRLMVSVRLVITIMVNEYEENECVRLRSTR